MKKGRKREHNKPGKWRSIGHFEIRLFAAYTTVMGVGKGGGAGI
jgi:hypothetical protein